MKKILSVLFLMVALIGAATLQSEAQTTFSQTISNQAGTITNAGTDTMYASVNASAYNVHAIQLTVTKTSGTVAGSGVLYGSVDGTYWVATGDTATLTNVASQTFVYVKSNSGFKRYRWLVTGSGTMVATALGKLAGYKYY